MTPAEIAARVERLRLPDTFLTARSGEVFRVRTVVYLSGEGAGVTAALEDGRRLELDGNLNAFEKTFAGLFVRAHRSFLVALDRITGVFERYPEAVDEGTPPPPVRGDAADECELELRGGDRRIPVTVKYAGGLKRALGTDSLHHLVPENTADKALRLYGLIDFGWRELRGLDPADAATVAAFEERWDVRKFSRERMLSYFRQFGVNEIDRKRVIKNILYQMYRWIKKGIEPPSDGNIRSLWYKVKQILSYHSNALEPGDRDLFYATLQEMVEVKRFFRYKDFGFMDMNEHYRGIGDRLPHVILAAEKDGLFIFIQKLAAQVGASFICLKGEPAAIAMEYFSDDLAAACGAKPKTIFSVSDIDPSGSSIKGSLIEGLSSRGHVIDRTVDLYESKMFTDEEIQYVRYPVVRFAVKGDQVNPIETTAGQVTKARTWLAAMNDPRLVTEKDQGDGWTYVTIWGIESDAFDREVIAKRFLDGVAGMGR